MFYLNVLTRFEQRFFLSGMQNRYRCFFKTETDPNIETILHPCFLFFCLFFLNMFSSTLPSSCVKPCCLLRRMREIFIIIYIRIRSRFVRTKLGSYQRSQIGKRAKNVNAKLRNEILLSRMRMMEQQRYGTSGFTPESWCWAVALTLLLKMIARSALVIVCLYVWSKMKTLLVYITC